MQPPVFRAGNGPIRSEKHFGGPLEFVGPIGGYWASTTLGSGVPIMPSIIAKILVLVFAVSALPLGTLGVVATGRAAAPRATEV